MIYPLSDIETAIKTIYTTVIGTGPLMECDVFDHVIELSFILPVGNCSITTAETLATEILAKYPFLCVGFQGWGSKETDPVIQFVGSNNGYPFDKVSVIIVGITYRITTGDE